MSAHALGHILASHAKKISKFQITRDWIIAQANSSAFKRVPAWSKSSYGHNLFLLFVVQPGLARSPLANLSCHLGWVAGFFFSYHGGFQVQQKMGKGQQCQWGSGEVSGWVVKQIPNMLHKALTMRNVFIIICSLLETCRFQSLRNSLAVIGVILAVIVQLDLPVFWIHYRPFKDGVHSYNTLYPLRAWFLWSFLLLQAAEKTI